MVTKALRAVLIEAVGAGRLDGDGVRTGHAEHPVCGDRIELDVRIEGRGDESHCTALAWRAEGCPATMAVAALAAPTWIGQPIARAEERMHARLRELGGLAATESHALAMLLRAFHEAIL